MLILSRGQREPGNGTADLQMVDKFMVKKDFHRPWMQELLLMGCCALR